MEATYWVSYAAISALVVLVCQLFSNWFNLSGQVKQYVSWGVSVVIAAIAVLLGACLDFGAFAGWEVANWYDWLQAIAVAIGCGLVANGLYDWEVIQKFLKALGLLSDK